MTCYNAYDLGIVRALHAILLMFILRDYPNDDAETESYNSYTMMDKITLLHPLDFHLHHHYNRCHMYHRHNKCHMDLTLEEA